MRDARDLRIGLLWRAEWDPAPAAGPDVERCRLHAMFAAFSALGVTAEPIVYSDDAAAGLRDRLRQLDGVLVWVNPIEHGLDRSILDALLRDVAAAGTLVSAHPDVILKIATKRVLVSTEEMSWSAGARVYSSPAELAEKLPDRLAEGSAVVLKQHRGMGGAGVWKVELDRSEDGATRLRVQHAESVGDPESVGLAEFVDRCRAYFAADGVMVEQPFLPRLREGMIRAYLSEATVVGFARQYPKGLLPPAEAASLPGEKAFLPETEPEYQPLRGRLESEWVPELQRIAGVETIDLPLIWDADFLLGDPAADGSDSYVLCEINASSTFAFPEIAMPTVARRAIERLLSRADRRPYGL